MRDFIQFNRAGTSVFEDALNRGASPEQAFEAATEAMTKMAREYDVPREGWKADQEASYDAFSESLSSGSKPIEAFQDSRQAGGDAAAEWAAGQDASRGFREGDPDRPFETQHDEETDGQENGWFDPFLDIQERSVKDVQIEGEQNDAAYLKHDGIQVGEADDIANQQPQNLFNEDTDVPTPMKMPNPTKITGEDAAPIPSKMPDPGKGEEGYLDARGDVHMPAPSKGEERILDGRDAESNTDIYAPMPHGGKENIINSEYSEFAPIPSKGRESDIDLETYTSDMAPHPGKSMPNPEFMPQPHGGKENYEFAQHEDALSGNVDFPSPGKGMPNPGKGISNPEFMPTPDKGEENIDVSHPGLEGQQNGWFDPFLDVTDDRALDHLDRADHALQQHAQEAGEHVKHEVGDQLQAGQHLSAEMAHDDVNEQQGEHNDIV